MGYRSVNVQEKGYDFSCDDSATCIEKYPQCKEVILRGCYHQNWHKGNDLNLNLRVNYLTLKGRGFLLNRIQLIYFVKDVIKSGRILHR